MKNPAFVLPAAMKGLIAFGNAAKEAGVPQTTLDLVHLRVSQINGCAVCLDLHVQELAKSEESIDRLLLVPAWREVPAFTAAERAALALAEAVTRVADNPGSVSDEVWAEATRHYDETQLAGLLVQIVAANSWNRLNGATHQLAGSVTAGANH